MQAINEKGKQMAMVSSDLAGCGALCMCVWNDHIKWSHLRREVEVTFSTGYKWNFRMPTTEMCQPQRWINLSIMYGTAGV